MPHIPRQAVAAPSKPQIMKLAPVSHGAPSPEVLAGIPDVPILSTKRTNKPKVAASRTLREQFVGLPKLSPRSFTGPSAETIADRMMGE